jgi:hypothetical protein
VGGLVAGYFVVIGVYAQFRRQSQSACRALLVEMRTNVEALEEMAARKADTPWEQGKANPGWLQRSVWDAQLPFLVQVLNQNTLDRVVRAYGTLDAIPEMALKNAAGPGPAYAYGGWIEVSIRKIQDAFPPAEAALGETVAAFRPSLDEQMRTLIQPGMEYSRKLLSAVTSATSRGFRRDQRPLQHRYQRVGTGRWLGICAFNRIRGSCVQLEEEPEQSQLDGQPVSRVFADTVRYPQRGAVRR